MNGSLWLYITEHGWDWEGQYHQESRVQMSARWLYKCNNNMINRVYGVFVTYLM